MNRIIKRLSVVAIVSAAVLTVTGPAQAQTSAAGTAGDGCSAVNVTLTCPTFADPEEIGEVELIYVFNSAGQVTATCPNISCPSGGVTTQQCATNGGDSIFNHIELADPNGFLGFCGDVSTAIPGSTACNGVILQVTCAHPQTKADCMNGGWMNYTNPSFKDQGQCIDYVNHQDG